MTTTNQKPGSADRHALRAGVTIEEIFNLTKIDRWFPVRISVKRICCDSGLLVANREHFIRHF